MHPLEGEKGESMSETEFRLRSEEDASAAETGVELPPEDLSIAEEIPALEDLPATEDVPATEDMPSTQPAFRLQSDGPPAAQATPSAQAAPSVGLGLEKIKSQAVRQATIINRLRRQHLDNSGHDPLMVEPGSSSAEV